MMSDHPKRRRWFQFRLRTLLIAVLVLSLPLSWLAVKIETARQQRGAMDLLESKGCTMYYRNSWWVQGVSVPVYVVASDSSVVDTDLKCLPDLSDLEGIELDNTAITDAGLGHLKGLANLEELYLAHTNVTPEGVKKLQEALPNCKIEY